MHVRCRFRWVYVHVCLPGQVFFNMISPIHLLISRSNSLVGSPMHSLVQLVTGPCCSKLACAMIIDMQPGLRPCQCKYLASFSKTSLGSTCEHDNKNDKVVVRHPPGQTLLHFSTSINCRCTEFLTFTNPDWPCLVQKINVSLSHFEKDLAAHRCLVMNKERMSHWTSLIVNFPLVDSLHDVSYGWSLVKG